MYITVISEHPNMCYDDDTQEWHPLNSIWEIYCEEHICKELKDDADYSFFIEING